MINPGHIKEHVITKSLMAIHPKIPYSLDATNLLFGTCAQESSMGKYLKQIGGGPALGIYQMEPKTYNDIFDNFLAFREDLAKEILQACHLSLIRPHPVELITNLKFATIMARLQYYRQPQKLPSASNLSDMARYWKKYYNTSLGKGTEEEFIANYKRFYDL